MNKKWVLTQDAFDQLLFWLDPDRNQAGDKYEQIRKRLIKIFTCRGCRDAEELADETINRVTAKAPELVGTYVGDPALYFYGVARNVRLEYLRTKQPVLATLPAGGDDAPEQEREYECMETCLARLPPDQRELMLQYYREQKSAKIECRKELARSLGIAMNALRIRAHRIRAALQQCMQECLLQKLAG